MKYIQKIDYKLLVIIIINLLLITFYFHQKNDFHGDEIYSFAHSNSRQGPYMVPNMNSFIIDTEHQLYNKTHPASFFSNYVTVSPEHRFNYKQVIDNLSAGVHPPFYYLILHTISSFFPETFNKWMAFPINIIAFTFSIFFLYKIASHIFEDKKLCYLSVILFGFSLITLSMAVFIRSYTLQTMLINWLIYEHLRLLKSNHLSVKQALTIFILSFLCYSTHYYLIIAVFFIASFTCLIFLINKKIKIIFAYAATVLASIALFSPVMLNALYNSSRGHELTNMVYSHFLLYFDKTITTLADLIMTKILPFDNFSGSLILVCLILAASFVKMSPYRPKINRNFIYIIFYTLPYTITITIIHPLLYISEERYFAPLTPTLCIIIIYSVWIFLRATNISDKIINYVLATLVLCNVFMTDFYNRSNFSFRTTQEDAKILTKIKGKKILFFNATHFSIINLVNDFKDTEYVKIIAPTNHKDFTDSIIAAKEDYIIITNSMASKNSTIPSPSKIFDSTLTRNLKYIKIFKKGLYFYELYKIITPINTSDN